MMSIGIFSVTHKQAYFPLIPFHSVIAVGPKQKNVLNNNGVINYTEDGENIEIKNHIYNELTAQYWIWKKDFDYDYIGLCHYRRYFNFSDKCNKRPRIGEAYFFKNQFMRFGWNEDQIKKVVEGADIITARPTSRVMPQYKTIRERVTGTGDYRGLLAIRDSIEALYPEYLPAYEEHLESDKCRSFNMFIMKKKMFDEYSEWLFAILERHENTWGLEHPDNMNRACGTLGEHLLNIWFLYQRNQDGICAKELQTIMFYETSETPSAKQRCVSFIKTMFTKVVPYNSKLRDKILFKFFYKEA